MLGPSAAQGAVHVQSPKLHRALRREQQAREPQTGAQLDHPPFHRRKQIQFEHPTNDDGSVPGKEPVCWPEICLIPSKHPGSGVVCRFCTGCGELARRLPHLRRRLVPAREHQWREVNSS